MALINIHDEEEMFGLREVEEDIASPQNLGSEAEDGYDDDVPEGEAPPQQQPAEAEEALDPSAAKVIKPKRVVKNPQPKFDAARLCGPRGIGVVQKFLSDAPYRGKGNETEDLGLLIQKLKHWTHRLYPKLPFLDSVAQIEKLGNKKAVQVNVKRLRLDMYDTPSESAAQDLVEDSDVVRMGDAPVDVDEPDVFDELLRQSGAEQSLQERVTKNASIPASQPVAISAEQQERIKRSRQLALERRRATLTASRRHPSGVDALGGSVNSGANAPSAGQPTPHAVRSQKRNFDEIEEPVENIQPTQEEVRKLREKLLGSVSSQPATSNSVLNEETRLAELDDDDYDAMDIDAAIDALNDAENCDGEKSGNKISKSNMDTAIIKDFTGASSHDVTTVENLSCSVSSDAQVRSSILESNDDATTHLGSQRESNTTSEALLTMGDKIDGESSCSSSSAKKLAVDAQSSVEDQPSDVVTSSVAAVEALSPAPSENEAAPSLQAPENTSNAGNSQGWSEQVSGAEGAELVEDSQNSNNSVSANDRPTDSDGHEAEAASTVVELPNKMENLASGDCDVSR